MPDEIVVVEFKTGGGLISYVKADGRFLYTLCDAGGFARTLQQLKIDQI